MDTIGPQPVSAASMHTKGIYNTLESNVHIHTGEFVQTRFMMKMVLAK